MHEQRMQIYILKRHFVHMAVMLAVFVTSISYTLLNFPESRHGYETFLAGVIGLPCFLCVTILKGPSSPTLHCAPRTLQLPFSMQPKIRNSVTVKVICFHRTSNGEKVLTGLRDSCRSQVILKSVPSKFGSD